MCLSIYMPLRYLCACRSGCLQEMGLITQNRDDVITTGDAQQCVGGPTGEGPPADLPVRQLHEARGISGRPTDARLEFRELLAGSVRPRRIVFVRGQKAANALQTA